MPELPEVQTIVDDLRKSTVGKIIKDIEYLTRSIWKSGVPDPAMIRGARIIDLNRVGKNILIGLSNDLTIVGHLKMTGKLTINYRQDPVMKHTHLIIKFRKRELRFNDIRRFGYLDLVKSGDIRNLDYLAQLGPDALAISNEEFINRIKSRHRAIKAILLDQTVLAGLGNIYSDESLFAAGIRPTRKGSGLSRARLAVLRLRMTEILKRAIKSRGSSVSDYVDGDGNDGRYQLFHKVYGRGGQPCFTCGTKIRRVIIAGRSSHYCPRCQH